MECVWDWGEGDVLGREGEETLGGTGWEGELGGEEDEGVGGGCGGAWDLDELGG